MAASKNNNILETLSLDQSNLHAEGPAVHHKAGVMRAKKWRNKWNKFRLKRKSILVPSILGGVAFVLMFVSVPVIWANKTAFSSDGFVAALENVTEDREFQQDVKASGTEYFMEEVESATGGLPFGLSDIFQQSLRAAIDRGLTYAVGDEKFQQAWKESLRKTHEGMVGRVDSKESIADAEGIPIVVQPLFNYLSGSVYQQLGFSSQDYSFDGSDETATSGIFHVGDSKVIGVLRFLRNSNLMAILLLAASVALMTAAVVLSRKPTVTVLVLGAILTIIAAAWYGCSLFFEKLIAKDIYSQNWIRGFTDRVAFEVTADFRIWIVTAALLGFLVMAGGMVSILVNGRRKSRTGRRIP